MRLLEGDVSWSLLPCLDRFTQAKGFPRQPADRSKLIVDVSNQRFTDEKMQPLDKKFIYQPAFDIGVTAGDERRLDAACGQSFQPEGEKFIFDVPSGERAAFVHCMQLILRADIDNKLAAFLDDLPAEIFVLNANNEQ